MTKKRGQILKEYSFTAVIHLRVLGKNASDARSKAQVNLYKPAKITLVQCPHAYIEPELFCPKCSKELK